jgi:dCMP deaminase
VSRQSEKLKVFGDICLQVSKLSYDPKYKVGAIIITDDFREVCSIGYNGNYKGGPNERDGMETGQSGFLHAEENALYHLTKSWKERNDLTMIVTHRPCRMCLKRIVNAGITKVFYLEEYYDNSDNSERFVQGLPLSVQRL